MVHLQTLNEQIRFYEKHKKEILSFGKRFAVITGSSVNYFDTRESLYKSHPYFKPDASIVFGTLPKLVDIWKENDTLEYRREQLEESKKIFDNSLVDILERGERLMEEERKLSNESRDKRN